MELAYPSMQSQFQQTEQMRSSIRPNSQNDGSAALCGKHRVWQGIQDDMVIHWSQGHLQLWWIFVLESRTDKYNGFSTSKILLHMSFACFISPFKSCSDGRGTKWQVELNSGSHSPNFTCSWPGDFGHLTVTWDNRTAQQHPRWLSSHFRISTAHPQTREGTRKGVPSIACPNQGSQYSMTGIVPIQQLKNNKEKDDFWSMECLYSHWQRKHLRTQKKNNPDCKELACYNIDIAPLSKRRLPEGFLCKPKEGYTFFWKGMQKMRTSVPASKSPNMHQLIAD